MVRIASIGWGDSAGLITEPATDMDRLPRTKTDGNGIVTTYGYDSLNRLLTETHNGNASANLTHCYNGLVAVGDGACGNPGTAIALGHGHETGSRSNLFSVGIVSATSYNGFDALGRVTGSQQVTNGSTPYVFSYGYDLGDRVTSETYHVTSFQGFSRILPNCFSP